MIGRLARRGWTAGAEDRVILPFRRLVCDRGDGFTPAPRLGAPNEPGGFGLCRIGRLADRWGVDTDDGTTVWFVLRR